MTRVAALVAVAACGRLDFDSSGGGIPDSPISITSLCGRVEIGDVAIAGTPRQLRAVPGGGTDMAVLIGTDTGNIYAVRVTAGNVVESVHLPLADAYGLNGAGEVGGNVFVHADYPPVETYLKRLDPSWDTYGTMDGGATGAIDPPIAAFDGGAKALQGMVHTGELALREIDPIGSELKLIATQRGVGGSLIPRAAGTRVAIDDGTGTCIVKDYPGTFAMTIPACAAPRFALGSNGSLLVHRKPGVMATIAEDLDQGTSTVLEGDRLVRAAVINGVGWIASQRDGVSLLARATLTGFAEAPVAFGAPFDFSPAGGLVWIDGGKLHTAEPCTP